MADALVPVELDPYNAETPMGVLSEPVTPAALVYVRNHFAVPEVDSESWRLRIGGSVEQPMTLSLADLQAMKTETVTMVLECAGNGRDTMVPQPPGTPWRVGAASTASFTGVALADVLAIAHPQPEAVEVLFRGADRGKVDRDRTETYERSLPVEVVGRPGPILAWEMGGEPLTAQHGAPLRLVVPGWYGMASVKWLIEIEFIDEPFRGFYQFERYIYASEDAIPDGTPVSAIRVRSVIASPRHDEPLAAGPVEVTGTAWSGEGPIARVEVSTDGGATWADAELGEAAGTEGFVPWRFDWGAEPGDHELVARATDTAGNRQPLEPVWNRWGYGNNTVHRVAITVTAA
jgi:DMSO/TMAO reductase YedYZ molybdopterin-dependent catalytic subunit